MSLIISSRKVGACRYVFIDHDSAEVLSQSPCPRPIHTIARIPFEQWKETYFCQLAEMLDGFYNALSTDACNKGYAMSTCRNVMYDQLAEYMYKHSSNASKVKNRKSVYVGNY